jgi:hypothetical protein
MASIGGEIGGKIGNSQNPFFTSPGGVTPQQQSLAEYDYGQNLLEGLAEYQGQGQGGGPIMSTMATQTAGGAREGEALDLSRLSDTNQTAMYNANQQAISDQQSNQANALNQISQLGKLASSAGSTAGAAGTAAGLGSGT